MSLPSARGPVQNAVDLGWIFAELYGFPSFPPPPSEKDELPLHLPGAGDMSEYDKALALIQRAHLILSDLRTDLRGVTADMSTVMDVLATSGRDDKHVFAAIYSTYTTVQEQLAASDSSVSVAFGLGRTLADTALRPKHDTPSVFAEVFGEYRLENAFKWLDDLDPRLPDKSAAAVGVSLRHWATWARRRFPAGQAPTESVEEGTVRALHRQGDLWRRLLTGEKSPKSLLRPEDFAGAAKRMLGHLASIALEFLRTWWKAAVVLVAMLILCVVLAVVLAPTGLSRVVALLAPVAVALGITWQGIGVTLGKTLTGAEQDLWAAEVTEAVALASIIPPPAAPRESRPKVVHLSAMAAKESASI